MLQCRQCGSNQQACSPFPSFPMSLPLILRTWARMRHCICCLLGNAWGELQSHDCRNPKRIVLIRHRQSVGNVDETARHDSRLEDSPHPKGNTTSPSRRSPTEQPLGARQFFLLIITQSAPAPSKSPSISPSCLVAHLAAHLPSGSNLPSSSQLLVTQVRVRVNCQFVSKQSHDHPMGNPQPNLFCSS